MRVQRSGPVAFPCFAVSSILAAWSAGALAGPDSCVGGSCQGDQSQGIAVLAPPASLEVTNLTGKIQPAPGVAGISFGSSGALDLSLASGSPSSPVTISTNGAAGVAVLNVGTPGAASLDPLLGIKVPGSGASGGTTRVDHYGDITTSGQQSHGIAAQSKTSGYGSDVIDGLKSFSTAGISFTVTGVAGPAGTPGTVGSPVSGQVLLLDSSGAETGLGGPAGKFNVAADGSVAFDPGTDFNDLAVGASRTVQATVTVDGYRGTTLADHGVTGTLYAQVTMTASGPQYTLGADFARFGATGTPQAATLAIPDLASYVGGLLSAAQGAGGAGNSVTVSSHSGTITTTGPRSHGIFAESTGSAGTSGAAGGGFWTFGLQPPSDGGAGNGGGDVTVTADGHITTTDQNPVSTPTQASVGVFAHSAGGAGGAGGDGGLYYSGRTGATGGNGGQVSVYGGAVIDTAGAYASGILALSDGGNGGAGGEGHFVSNGGAGGAGGQGGPVTVAGNWTVTTLGADAYGIWAKSVGGDAGSGGSSGWAAGKPGNGGQATDGGAVALTSGGTVTTHGTGAFGLFAESVGGFGGSGGVAGSIFFGRGGSAASAGSGGAVSITNLAGGVVTTFGVDAHAIVAQSIGGGGGAGGGAAAVFGFGGAGAAGGDGSTVTVANAGSIATHGDNARGIYAQSVGGSGGDGGNAAGLLAIGGNASGTSNGGDVNVTNGGVIRTDGTGSNAVFAQSVGGGGGSGGSSTGWFAIGGKGAGGGNAGGVSVINSGSSLVTSGADATAVFAQSVGGGGGKGGNSTAVGLFGSVAIGGYGAAGGTGADVSVQSLSGAIETSGDRSNGLFAQSVGGGGGNGGFATAASVGVGAGAQRPGAHLLPQSAIAPAKRGPAPARRMRRQSDEERRAAPAIHPSDRAAAGLSPYETRAGSLRNSAAQLAGASP